jgi:diacylglycerol kinase
MRFHIVASLAILIFSFFFNLNIEKYCILFLTISSVIVSEFFNTAVENVVDIESENYSVMAKAAKDIAAGAVLVSACFAVLVGILLFCDFYCYINMLLFFIFHPFLALLLILFAIFSYFYVIWGPTEIKNKAKKFIKIVKNRK